MTSLQHCTQIAREKCNKRLLRNTIKSRDYESLTGFSQDTMTPGSKLQQIKPSLTIFYTCYKCTSSFFFHFLPRAVKQLTAGKLYCAEAINSFTLFRVGHYSR